MGMVRPALELRVILHSYKEIPVRELHSLHQAVVRGKTAQHQSFLCKGLAVFVIEFVSVAVPLMYQVSVIELLHNCPFLYAAWITSKAQCATLVYLIALSRHEVYYFIFAVRGKLS